MYKVIYFDEGSATDFLQIHYWGNIEVVDEENDICYFLIFRKMILTEK